MLFLAEQAFVGRNEKRAPLKTPAWEAIRASVWSKNKWGGGGLPWICHCIYFVTDIACTNIDRKCWWSFFHPLSALPSFVWVAFLFSIKRIEKKGKHVQDKLHQQQKSIKKCKIKALALRKNYASQDSHFPEVETTIEHWM